LNWQVARRLSLQDVAREAGVDVETVVSYREGNQVASADKLAPLVAEYELATQMVAPVATHRRRIRVPQVVGRKLAAFLGYLIGDGHISEVKRTIGLTTGDKEQADRFAFLVTKLFAIPPRQVWDEGRW